MYKPEQAVLRLIHENNFADRLGNNQLTPFRIPENNVVFQQVQAGGYILCSFSVFQNNDTLHPAILEKWSSLNQPYVFIGIDGFACYGGQEQAAGYCFKIILVIPTLGMNQSGGPAEKEEKSCFHGKTFYTS